MLDENAAGGEPDGCEYRHDNGRPRRKNWYLSEFCSNLRLCRVSQNSRECDEDRADDDEAHTDPVVHLKVNLVHALFGSSHVEWTECPNDSNDAWIHFCKIGEPHGHEGHKLSQEVAQAVSDEAAASGTIALAHDSRAITFTLSCLVAELMIHLELPGCTLFLVPESVVEAHDYLIDKTDEDCARSKVKQALRALCLRDLADTLVADGEEYGGTEGPEEPNHALLLAALCLFILATMLTGLFVDCFDSFE